MVHCSNIYYKEKLEKFKHLHYVFSAEFLVGNENDKQEDWVVTRKMPGKIQLFFIWDYNYIKNVYA